MTKPEDYVPFLELKTSSATCIIPFDTLESLLYSEREQRLAFYVKNSKTEYWDGYSTARAKQHIEFFKYFTYQRLTQGILS